MSGNFNYVFENKGLLKVTASGNWTLRLRDTSPTGQFAYSLVISPTGHFAYWSFRLPDISPTGHFTYWTVHPLDISPTAWTVRLQILHI